MRNGPEVLICVSVDATLTLPCLRQIEIERILGHFLEGKTGDDFRHPELCVDWAQNLETARSDTHRQPLLTAYWILRSLTARYFNGQKALDKANVSFLMSISL